MDDIQQTPLTPNGSDLQLAAYPDYFRRVNPESNANILVLIIVIIFVKFLMIFGLYAIKKKKNQDEIINFCQQYWRSPKIFNNRGDVHY